MSQELYELFQKCTVKLSLPTKKGWGTGFFVAPNLILTCAHVIKDAIDQRIQVAWQEQNFEALVLQFIPENIDLALLQLDENSFEHPCVLLDTSVEPGDDLYTFGYPDDTPAGAPATLQAEGFTGDSPPFIKFKSGQVRPGMSGSPLLNVRTRRVCGLIKFTRDRSQDLGGGATPTTTIFVQFPELSKVNQEFHQQNRQWKRLLSPYRKPRRLQQNREQAEQTRVEQSFLENIITPRIETHAVEKTATADRPVESLEEDYLGFNVYVRALKEFISSQDTGTPLTIAIDGRWGTGKTSLMRMLQTELESHADLWQWLRSHESRFKPTELLWLRWFISYIVTFPIWFLGRVLIEVDDLFFNRPKRHFRAIRIGLSHDPYTHSVDELLAGFVDPKIKPEKVRFWANVAAKHSFLPSINHPTIWFNAWKFDEEEQLWSALALSVIEQLKSKYGFFQRIFFWIRLTFKRFSPLVALWSLLEKIGLPILLGIFAWKYDYYLKQIASQKAALPEFATLGQPILWIGAILSGLSQVRSILKDPFQVPTERVINNPNYREKIGFIARFEHDFANIVSIATRPFWGCQTRKLVIFIDDLDRCEPPKSVNIIEAINLFLDSKGCVFVLGMDSTAVIASIEIKYCDILEKMKQENPGLVSPGKAFLDKIIQIPFQVPPITSDKIVRLLDSLTKREVGVQLGSNFGERANKQQNKSIDNQIYNNTTRSANESIDIASYAREDIQDSIYLCINLFKDNPRQIKRFVNLFRLQVYIANERGILEHYINDQKKQVGITLDYLAIWVGFSLQYSNLIKCFFDTEQFLELRNYINQLSSLIEDSGNLSSIENLIEDIGQLQEEKKAIKYHWCHLPWQSWFLDPNFLWGVKELECFWNEASGEQVDWLRNILTMSKITLGEDDTD